MHAVIRRTGNSWADKTNHGTSVISHLFGEVLMRFERYTGLVLACTESDKLFRNVYAVAILILCDISYSFNNASLCLLYWIADRLLHAESFLLPFFLLAGQLIWC